jgi:hypothetical protein
MCLDSHLFCRIQNHNPELRFKRLECNLVDHLPDLVNAESSLLGLYKPDIGMAFPPDKAIGTAAAKAFLQGQTWKTPAFDYRSDSDAGGTMVARFVFDRRKTIQTLGEQERKRAFADSGRTGKNHGMRQPVLFD